MALREERSTTRWYGTSRIAGTGISSTSAREEVSFNEAMRYPIKKNSMGANKWAGT
jgi:hypothetical protein